MCLIRRASHLPLRRKSDDEEDRLLCKKAGHGEIVIKAVDGDAAGTIEGYGSVFDKVDSYGERVVKGAFKKSLVAWRKSKKPIPMLWQHQSDMPIGVWDDYYEDEVGLFLKGRLNLETSRGKDAWSDIRMKAVSGLSIGYYEVLAQSWDRPANEPRDLIELDLRETSPVTFPALREAQIDVVKARRVRGERVTEREFEADLRERHQLSRAEATFVSRFGWKAFLARDASGGVEDETTADLVKAAAELKLPPFEL